MSGHAYRLFKDAGLILLIKQLMDLEVDKLHLKQIKNKQKNHIDGKLSIIPLPWYENSLFFTKW